MKIQGLYDIDQNIKVNNLKEVKSQAIYKSPNVFHSDGLFSEEIFGQTPDERDFRCAYIKLPLYIFNPQVAKTIISRSGGIIRKMAYGDVKCNIVDGVLTASPDGQYCGLKDLYEIWDQIDIRKTLTTRSEKAVTILTKTPKRLLFSNKIIVIPPNMRQIGIKNGKQVKSELNTLYSQVLGFKGVLAHTTSTSMYSMYNKFQDASIAIYTYINNYCGGKNGFFQKNLLAKNTLWAARNVISAPKYNSNDIEIGIFKTGYPLHSLCSMFNPIIKFHMKQFLSYNNIQDIHPNKDEVKLADITNIYDNKMINDLLEIYMKNPGSRFRILYLDPENTKPIMFEAFDVKRNQKISRPLTLTDVVYLCAKAGVVDADRMCYTVRYPIGDYLGAFFTKVHILSTITTSTVEYRGERMTSYPDINPELTPRQVSILFMDTINMSNSRLKPLGADYDGDTVKSLGLWSDEANKRAAELMYSKAYNITPQGTSIYEIGIECLNGLYGLTKRKEVA